MSGGWFPLLIAGLIAFLMLTWREGVLLVERARAHLPEDEADFVANIDRTAPCRIEGTGAFLSAATSGIPLSLTHHLRHNRSLQRRVLLLSVVATDKPHVAEDRRAELVTVGDGIDRIVLRYGFMEALDVPSGLKGAKIFSEDECEHVSFYNGRETVIADPKVKGMAPWREHLFVSMQRNTTATGSSFCIPSSQVVEIGTEVRI